MAKKKVAKAKPVEHKEEKAKVSDDVKLWAILSSVIVILFFVPLCLVKPRDNYAVYYAKQAFMLFIAAVVISIASGIPFIGWWIIGPIGGLAIFILWIIGIVHAASNKMKPLPVIGKLAIDWFKTL